MTLSLKRTDYALDIGAARVRAFEAGKGVVLDVPVEDLVDVSSVRDRGERLAAVCRAALVRIGARGRFVSRVRRAVLSVPSGIGEVEKRVYEEAARLAGVPELYLIELPMAAAIGGGGPVSKSEAVTVVDIGASRIQAAVISLAGIVAWREAVRADEVSPERVGDLVRSVISECIAKGRYNLADDIVRQGVLLTGGGALTPGLADSMQSALNLPVRVADDPQLAVILGAGVVLGELDKIFRPKTKAPTPWAGLLIFAIVMLSLCKKHGLINRVIDLFVR